MSVGQRAQRTLLTIAFFYALYNPTPYNLLNGFALWALTVLSWNSTFWMAIQGVVFTVVVLALAAFMIRRWQLTKTQANLPILAIMTLALKLALIVIVALIGRYFAFTWENYWTAAQWTWQIPAGFFIGTGLSWSIKDRQLSGVVAVDQRDVVHDAQAGDLHHHVP